MLIKFRDTDPRAGTVAQMDSRIGQQLIDSGAADQIREDGTDPARAAVPDDRAKLDAALAELPDDYTDPDFVVNAMRFYFGPVFTADDEAIVRERVKAPAPSAVMGDGVVGSDGAVASDEQSQNVPGGEPMPDRGQVASQTSAADVTTQADQASPAPATPAAADVEPAAAPAKSTKGKR